MDMMDKGGLTWIRVLCGDMDSSGASSPRLLQALAASVLYGLSIKQTII